MGVRGVLFALAGIIQCSAAVLQACSTTLLPQMDSAGAWHAQAGQDRLVSSILNGRRNGYFVDLAAAAPLVLSNSRALERDFRWRGLCIEGNADLAAALSKQRSCTVIKSLISSSAGNVTFAKQDSGRQGFSRIVATSRTGSKGQTQAASPLEAVLRANSAPAVMDYLSLDVRQLVSILRHLGRPIPATLSSCLASSPRADRIENALRR